MLQCVMELLYARLTARLVVVATRDVLISRLRLADHRVAIGSPAHIALPCLVLPFVLSQSD